jgi:hypothetical protein
MTFHRDAYEGSTRIKTTNMDQPQHFSGKYLSACDEK